METNTNAHGMLPNGRAATSAQIGAPASVAHAASQLKPNQITLAQNCIDKIYDGYTGKGGVLELEAKLDSKRGALAMEMRKLAIEAVNMAANNLNLAKTYFLAMCYIAETHLKDKHQNASGKSEKVQDILPLWPQFKNTLVAGFKEKINPKEIGSVSAIKTAVKGIRDARIAEEEAKKATGGTNATGPRLPDAGVMVKAGWDTKLASVINVLHVELQALSPLGQEKAASLLQEAVKKIHDLRKDYGKEPATDAEAAELQATAETNEDDVAVQNDEDAPIDSGDESEETEASEMTEEA